MPRRSDEEDHAAPPLSGFSTPNKASRNDGAGHAEPDAEGTEDESDLDVEKKFDESTGKKRNYTGYHTCRLRIPCWRMPKLIMKSTPRWRNLCMRAA